MRSLTSGSKFYRQFQIKDICHFEARALTPHRALGSCWGKSLHCNFPHIFPTGQHSWNSLCCLQLNRGCNRAPAWEYILLYKTETFLPAEQWFLSTTPPYCFQSLHAPFFHCRKPPPCAMKNGHFKGRHTLENLDLSVRALTLPLLLHFIKLPSFPWKFFSEKTSPSTTGLCPENFL